MTSVAVLALCFNSCKEKNKPEPEPEPEPQPQPTVPTIAVAINNVSYTEIAFSVTPSDTAATYAITYYAPNYVESKSNAELQAAVKAEIDESITFARENYGLEFTYADFLNNGAKNYYFDELYPGTAYAIVVSYMDTLGNFTGEVAVAVANTLAVVEPTGEEVTLGALTANYFEDYRDYDNSWMMYFGDEAETIELCLSIFADEIGGNFSTDDLDVDYSYLWIENELETIGFQSIAVTSNVSSDGKTANFAGNVVAYNGIKYIFTATANLEELIGEESGLAARRISKKAAAPKKMAQRK